MCSVWLRWQPMWVSGEDRSSCDSHFSLFRWDLKAPSANSCKQVNHLALPSPKQISLQSFSYREVLGLLFHNPIFILLTTLFPSLPPTPKTLSVILLLMVICNVFCGSEDRPWSTADPSSNCNLFYSFNLVCFMHQPIAVLRVNKGIICGGIHIMFGT